MEPDTIHSTTEDTQFEPPSFNNTVQEIPPVRQQPPIKQAPPARQAQPSSESILNTFLSELAATAVIPTTSQTVKVKPITIKQIKDVVDNSIAIPYFDVGFKRGVTQVLKENLIIDTDLNALDTITELDIQLLFPYLRYDGTIEEVPVSNYLTKSFDSTIATVNEELVFKDIVIRVKSPSLRLLQQHEDYLLKNIKLNDKKELLNEKELSTIYFLIDISKYIDSIKTSSGNVELLKNCSIEERLKIVEQLPYQVANGIIDFNRRIEEYINDLLTFEEKTLSFDMSFFE